MLPLPAIEGAKEPLERLERLERRASSCGTPAGPRVFTMTRREGKPSASATLGPVLQERWESGDNETAAACFKTMWIAGQVSPCHVDMGISASLRVGQVADAIAYLGDMPNRGLKPGALTWTAFRTYMGSCTDAITLLACFNATRDAGYVADRAEIQKVISACAHAGRLDDAVNLFNSAAAQLMHPDLAGIRLQLARDLCEGGHHLHVLRVFEAIRKPDVPCIEEFGYAIRAHAALSQPREAIDLWIAMSDSDRAGVDDATFEALLHAFERIYPCAGLRTGAAAVATPMDAKAAAGLLDAMRASRRVPTTQAFNLLLVLARSRGGEPAAREAFAQRALAWLRGVVRAGLEPDTNTYDIILTTCAEGGRAVDALDYLDEFFEHAVKPDVHTYNRAIWACGKGGVPGRIDGYLAKMRERRMQPDFQTFSCAIAACGDDDAGRRQAGEYLARAKEAWVFDSSLGLWPDRAVLDFRESAVRDVRMPGTCQPDQTVAVPVARAIFDHFADQGAFREDTRFVVGNDPEFRRTVVGWMKERHMNPVWRPGRPSWLIRKKPEASGELTDR
ncbi:MAG TPA: hypothetical protein VHA82_14750 [Ramlibacter sp.]|uniref:hypothetical protein n=1 Tax=Ramlibacter sp. TaxID=1917967 RepID=UPI002C4B1590|nr:hypothetical protein [Ramlibacter sp.]HVZ45067.1 hypothetical protein [Ramlibacter sp.]